MPKSAVGTRVILLPKDSGVCGFRFAGLPDPATVSLRVDRWIVLSRCWNSFVASSPLNMVLLDDVGVPVPISRIHNVVSEIGCLAPAPGPTRERLFLSERVVRRRYNYNNTNSDWSGLYTRRSGLSLSVSPFPFPLYDLYRLENRPSLYRR